ncbi:MAG: hypothetical protein AAF750_14695 [Planctomycetota bacterium]
MKVVRVGLLLVACCLWLVPAVSVDAEIPLAQADAPAHEGQVTMPRGHPRPPTAEEVRALLGPGYTVAVTVVSEPPEPGFQRLKGMSEESFEELQRVAVESFLWAAHYEISSDSKEHSLSMSIGLSLASGLPALTLFARAVMQLLEEGELPENMTEEAALELKRFVVIEEAGRMVGERMFLMGPEAWGGGISRMWQDGYVLSWGWAGGAGGPAPDPVLKRLGLPIQRDERGGGPLASLAGFYDEAWRRVGAWLIRLQKADAAKDES